MPNTYIINKADFEFKNRFDSELYNPLLTKSYNELNSNIKTLTKLKDICIIRSGSTPSDRDDNLNSGPILFKTTDIRNNVLNSKDTYYHISFKIHERMSNTKLKSEDVLLNIVGATLDVIGRSAYTSNYFDEANITQAMVLLRLKETAHNFKSGFIFCFLNTKYAQDQIKRFARPTGQYNLNLIETGSILIPILSNSFQEEIQNKVLKVGELQKQSSNLYTQAQELLEKELGLDKIEFNKDKYFASNLSENIYFNRCDCEYYQPLYKKLKNVIITYQNGYEPLLKNIQNIKPNINPSEKPLKTFNYIELSNIKENLGVVEGSLQALGKNAPSRAQRIVKTGDILASSVVGSVNKSAIVSTNEDGYLASSGFFHFRSNYYTPEFLLLLVQSKIIKMQLQQEATSGILSAVPNDNLKYILIPLIPKELQNKITELIRQSHYTYRESKSILLEAIKQVEDLIENKATE
jgi:restriction endonuclease S subunit